jgi:hypothetical protein
MAEYNSMCALTGLPIQKGEAAKIIFLRECTRFRLSDLYWVPNLDTAWKPLLFPVSGIYSGHGFVENWEEGVETQLLLQYFSQENIMRDKFGEEGKNNRFTFKEGDFDDMTTKLCEDKALLKMWRGEVYLKHSYCLVGEKAYNYVLNLFAKDVKTFEEIYHNSLIEYLCQYSCLGAKWVCLHNFTDIFTEADFDLDRNEMSKVYLERGGIPITEDPSADFATKLNHARCISERSTHFLYHLSLAIAGDKLAYIAAAEDSPHKEQLIKLMVESIVLNQLCQYWGTQYRWQPLKTFAQDLLTNSAKFPIRLHGGDG